MKKLLAFIVAVILCLSCFAACGKKNEAPQNNESTPTQVVYDVEDAAAYLKNMYKKYLVETETAADFTLVSQVMKGGVVYKVTWTTDREDIKVIVDEENKQVKIDLNEKTKVDITYKLTATITDPDGKTSTLTFELKVPKYVLSTWEEYMAMEAGKAVVVEGYIAAVHAPSEGNKYNTLYLHDVNNKGGYYVYSMASDKDLVKDLGLKKGMLVSVTGTKDIYSGTHEIKDASVNVLDTTVVDFKPLDITATYKAATTLKDKALTDKLGMLVTIKGVEITDQDLSEKSQYLNFKLAGLTTYIRVYATDCPASVTDAGQKSIIEEHGKKKGYEADVTGVVVMYSGAIYLNPVSDTPFAYGKKIERTPEQMVEVEIEDLKFEKDIAIDKTITLPSKGKSYEDVVITWKSNSEAIVIEDGKAKIKLQDEATTASITGTFTLGTITKTATYTFNLAKKSSVVAQIATNPVPGTAYKFFVTHSTIGKVLYLTGDVANTYYGASTTNPNEAVDVYLEEATGGYYLTFTKGGTKQYLTIVSAIKDNKTVYNVSFTADKPANPFVLDSALENAPVITIDGEKAYIGAYGTYETFSASAYSYATRDGSFVAHLGTVVDTNTIAAADKVAAEKEGLSIEDDEFFVNTEIDLTTAGSIYDDVTITWASSNTTAAAINGGKLTITLGETKQTVTLTATLTCGTATDTKTFTIEIDAIPTDLYAPIFTNAPVAGKAYKFAIKQATLGKTIYVTGEVNGRYLSTTEKITEGADVYVETVTGGYKFYILDGETKKYITVYNNDSNKLSVKYDAAGTSVYTYVAETNCWKTTFENTEYYLGTYSDYNTVSASKTSYINATNTGVSQFPAEFAIVADAAYATDNVVTPSANTAYKFSLYQATLNKTLYVTGEVSGRYLSTTEKLDDAADVYVEAVTGGYKFYILDGETKKYITVYNNDSNKLSVKYDAAGTSVYTYVAETNCWKTTFENTEYYLGTYSDYNTVSASKTSYINATNTGVSQFPANIVTVSLKPIVPVGKTQPVADTAYKFSLYQATLGKTLYVTGEVNGRYLSTTEQLSKAADVYVETATGGYKFYIFVDGVKQYITVYNNDSNKLSVKYDAAGTSVYTYVAETNCWKTTFENTEYYLGTYSNYNTVSASKTSYINATNTGVSQFPANICAMEFYTPDTDADDNQGGNTGSGNEGGAGGSTTPSGSAAATFALGTDDASKTNEGNQAQDGTGITIYTESNNGYTLTLSSLTKVYGGAHDAKGNACLKLGASSSAGSMTFTVPADITSVKIYVAGYKTNTGKFTINGGTATSTTKKSANGEYDVITVDTSSTKTITFATVSGGYRVKINTIEFCK